MMPRPFNRQQALENQAFLDVLAQTANIKMAARAVGRASATMHHRRRIDAEFAGRWERAVVFARARNADAARTGCVMPAPAPKLAAQHRTRGGEPVTMRLRSGQMQLRRAHPGKLAKGAEQVFLAALSATCNVRLAAAAAGASPQTFYRRKRQRPGFAREWRFALEQGYEALEMALIASYAPASYADDAWRHNDPPPIPAMTVNQALQLMYLHQKEARLIEEPPHLKKRRYETEEDCRVRLGAVAEEQNRRKREAFFVAEAARRAQGKPHLFGPLVLPSLDQINAWSAADPTKRPHHAERALFGGWRLDDWEKRGR